MIKNDVKEMTDRQLMESIASRQDKIESRLFDIDIEMGMCMNSIRTLCAIQGAHTAAEELAAYIAEKRKRVIGNGVEPEAEIKTGPG